MKRSAPSPRSGYHLKREPASSKKERRRCRSQHASDLGPLECKRQHVVSTDYLMRPERWEVLHIVENCKVHTQRLVDWCGNMLLKKAIKNEGPPPKLLKSESHKEAYSGHRAKDEMGCSRPAGSCRPRHRRWPFRTPLLLPRGRLPSVAAPRRRASSGARAAAGLLRRTP